MRAGLAFGLALWSAAAAGAQVAPPGPSQAPARDEAFRMIDAYVVSNLQDSLALSDDQFVKLLPIVKRLQNERRDLLQRRQQMLRELRQTLLSGAATETAVTERLKDLKGIEAELPDRERRNIEAIDAVLNPLQQAKFRLMEAEIEQRIRELLRQMRVPRRPEERKEPDPGKR